MSVFIIAEAGVNHNGDMQLARLLIEEAAQAGADAIKFQNFMASQLTTKKAPLADYQKSTSSGSQRSMLERLELTPEQTIELRNYATEQGIMFLSSAFDRESIDLLAKMQLPFMKIPSGEITNLPYLRHIGKLRCKVVLSTGMSTLGEIQSALDVLDAHGAREVILLQCNTEYPTPMEDVNLLGMLTLKSMFNRRVGYSDHTLGIEVPIAAAALGAEFIEKHFTIDKNLPGPDHKASLEPAELRAMVRAIRNIEVALGDGRKQPTPSELKNKEAARKSIVAAKAIQKGELFSEDNLTVKRPGNGISPMLWDELIGKPANKDYAEDEVLSL